jgi:cytochrome c oxidase subunit 2
LTALALVDTRHEYYRVFDVYVPIAVGIFAVILLIVVIAVVVYRRRPPERVARWHENNPLEGAYALALACVAAFLLYLTFSAEHATDTLANAQRPAVVVDVTAAKWEWQFAYPAYGFSTRSGTVGRQPLVMPAGEPVRLRMSSQDVIHALWIPQARYKHDLFAGSTQVVTLTFPHTGTYPGQCAEFCGLRHADMVFTVDVVSPARFTAWARRHGQGRP